MKEYVFVEFLFSLEEYSTEFTKLVELGDDFSFIKLSEEYEIDEDNASEYIRISGKINSHAASMIKLRNPALAGKMRISYISDDLKNKYRR